MEKSLEEYLALVDAFSCVCGLIRGSHNSKLGDS
jgi:hypothetical protein